MSQRNIMICDRCGEEITSSLLGMTYYVILEGSVSGISPRSWDICKSCEKDLMKWMRGKE